MVLGNLLAGAAGGASVSIFINAIDNFSGTFKTMNSSLVVAGTAITALGVAGAAAIAGLTGVAIKFEDAFTGVKKTVELSESEFELLNKRFKDLSKEIPITFVELSRIGELAGQLGVEGVHNLTKFTKTIADISVTTNLTAETAATDFARIANVMQEPLANIDKMGSVIVELGNNFATTEAEISTFAQRISGASKIVGISTAEVFALGTAFSSIGIEAEAGGSAVQRGLLEINKAVSTGSEKLEIFATTAGLSVEEFSKLWEEDAANAFEKFIVGLGRQGDQAQITLDDLGLGGIRTARAFLSMSNAGDLITRTIKTGNEAWIENNALTEEANKRYETAQSQIVMFKNKLASLADDMGKVFIPILITVLDKLGMFINFLEKHPTLTKFAVAAIAIASAIALVVGPIAIMIALLPTLIGLMGVLSAVSLPVTATILAVAAAVGALVWLIKEFIQELDKIKGRKKASAHAVVPVTPNESGVIALGGGYQPTNVINIGGDVVGVDPEDMSIALAKSIKGVIKL